MIDWLVFNAISAAFSHLMAVTILEISYRANSLKDTKILVNGLLRAKVLLHVTLTQSTIYFPIQRTNKMI